MPVLRRAGLAHQDEDLAARIVGAARPPLAAVDHVVVAVALDAAGNVGGIRRRDRGLGHQEGRADLAGEQRLQPAILLFFVAVALDRLHVAGVRRGAIEHLRRPRHAPHDLAQRRVLQVGQAFGCARRARQEQIPQLRIAGPRLELFDQLQCLEGIAGSTVRGHFS
jgi:hypothetical protein